MMIVADFDAASLARVRIAPSPLFDAVTWLQLLVGADHGHPFLVHDASAARSAAGHPDVRLAASLLSGAARARYTPDFMLPVPDNGTVEQVVRAQLDSVAATSAEVASAELDYVRAFGGRVAPAVGRAAADGSLARRIARGMQVFWHRVVAPRWTVLDHAYTADLHQRSAIASTRGLGALFTSLHPELAWSDSRLIAPMSFDEHVEIRRRDVVLVPSLMRWPRYSVQFCSGEPTIVYPVDGAGTSERPRVADTELLGAGRAAVLGALGRPRSTIDISRDVGLAQSTVSYHLQVLLRSQLVDRARSGRRVVYVQTTRGRDLCAAISR